MLKLKKRITIHVPDRLAVVAVLALMVTAAVGIPGNQFGSDGKTLSKKDTATDARPVPALIEATEGSSKNAGRQGGGKLRLLLFRRG